jgi:hypothetical protein
MAKIRAGILSKVQGKVAGVVGATWKGKNYLRELVKPANPNTPRQQLQRAKMSTAVKASRWFLGGVLDVYTNPFLKDMSGYNWFIKQNIGEKVSQSTDIKSLQLAFGTLAMPTIEEGSEGGSENAASIAVELPSGLNPNSNYVLVAGTCKKDGSAGFYSIVDFNSEDLQKTVTFPTGVANITSGAFQGAFIAEVEKEDNAITKVIRCSNTFVIDSMGY